MYGTGHSERPSRMQLLAALEQLEAAVARHERLVREALGCGLKAPAHVRRSLEMLREEADHLRLLLGAV